MTLDTLVEIYKKKHYIVPHIEVRLEKARPFS